MHAPTATVLFLALAAASPAFVRSAHAQSAHAPSVHAKSTQAQSVLGGALPDCECRSARGPARIGERLCLATPEGWRVAVCAMDQNVTSWRPTPDSCAPVSRAMSLRQRPPGA